MSNTSKCVVCDKPVIPEDTFTPHCKQCKYVYRICFGSVGDGKIWARAADLYSLRNARRYEIDHRNRKSVLRIIDAEIYRLS